MYAAPLRLVAEDRPTFSSSQHLRTYDGPAQASIRDRDTKTKKRICIETLKQNNLLLMTISVQIYEIKKEFIKVNSKGSLNSF
jgi:hypothetical protein